MDRQSIIKACEEQKVHFLRLQFTDILGNNKNVEVPISQLDRALDGKVHFDGSSIEGFARIEESDMRLLPDLDSFVVLPFTSSNGSREARVICDIAQPDGRPFAGCPRQTLRRLIAKAQAMDLRFMVGPEIEFFLFHRDAGGQITTDTHDAGGYFDLAPVDRGELARRRAVEVLEALGFEIEASHHEVACAQHEIDFRYEEALRAADHICTFKFVLRKVALEHNLHATFMPKPIFGQNGSGMHTNMSLMRGDANLFHDPQGRHELSQMALHFIGGLLHHARAFSAITNSLINSYKRLVPGYEAPTTIAWAMRNRSPLIRIPAARGRATRVELRSPDPSCNPYLALSVVLAAGLDGIERQLDPGEPIPDNVYELDDSRRKDLRLLPGSLAEACDELERSALMRETLGGHVLDNYLRAKREVWREYSAQVHAWEIDRYLAVY